MSEQEMNLPTAIAVEGATFPSVGAYLAASREAQGWSVEQVANQLNLATRQVQAIERGDYAALPGMSIARGFIRAYAKLLKIDAAPLLAAIPGGAEKAGDGILARETLSAPFADTRLPSMADRPVISGKWYVFLVILILVLAGLWAQQQGMLRVVTDPIKAMWVSQTGSGNAGVPAVSAPVQQSTPVADDQAKKQESVPQASSQTESSTETTASNSTSSENEVSAPASAPESSAPAEPASKQQDQTLALNVHADSWVEVRRADNTIVFSGLINAGKTQSFDLDGPVSVVIGNASGVDASYRGAPLELKANTGSNVVRLNLK